MLRKYFSWSADLHNVNKLWCILFVERLFHYSFGWMCNEDPFYIGKIQHRNNHTKLTDWKGKKRAKEIEKKRKEFHFRLELRGLDTRSFSMFLCHKPPKLPITRQHTFCRWPCIVSGPMLIGKQNEPKQVITMWFVDPKYFSLCMLRFSFFYFNIVSFRWLQTAAVFLCAVTLQRFFVPYLAKAVSFWTDSYTSDALTQ